MPRPEALQFSDEGEPYSARYGDVYASRAGAAGQAREVFLRGCGLLDQPATWQDRRQFVVLETGFGLGTNFLATWQAWRADPRRPLFLHYVALELHPLRAEDLLRGCVDPALAGLARELAAQWPPAMRGLHLLSLDGGRVRLLLALGDAHELLPLMELGADAVFLDGFAPSRNPRMWSRELLLEVARLCRGGARAASYTVARAVCDGLREAGFEVRKLPGYGGKAQRLEARLLQAPPGWRARAAREHPGRALVVGAGLAGAACAHALAMRGWQVQVLDARGVAAGASALPAGLAHLRPAHADDRLARLTRAALAQLLAALPAGDLAGLRGGDGVLMSSDSPRRAALVEQADAWPADWLRPLDAAEAAAIAGTEAAPRAWWTAGGAVAAGALCRGWLAHPGIRVVAPAPVEQIRRAPGTPTWQALDAGGQVLAQAEICVLACAHDTERLLRASGLGGTRGIPRMRTQNGQGFVVPAAALPGLQRLHAGVMSGTYALPLPPGALAANGLDPAEHWLFVGATYEHPDQAPLALEQAWRHVGDGLRAWCSHGHWPEQPPAQARAFRAERAVTGDRLPLIGAWPDAAAPADNGLYLSAGMGSRGLLLSALGAQCIASLVEGEPAPLERDLLQALDASRDNLRRA
ncbi:MAG: FAD-dependent 5-carboxymethylaminomethyl-2-thiouridine(34) oxidoreductase MnmC [Betaproteobacteria bacterium]|nr:FAD-dependent 5-carboxymethylaminomethyl-2-thiouridine(34) oxidoreductase MnmC [Betaproteobacteria bacterium]